MPTALITGITGQDGAYLAQFLLSKGYDVYGTFRRVSTPNFWRLQALDIFDDVHKIPADLVDLSSLIEAVRISRPDELYNLASQSFVGASFTMPIVTGLITGMGVTKALEAVRQINKNIRFYQASTSELFGNASSKVQNEETPFWPQSPYAAAKLYGHWMVEIYRSAYDMFTCNGILFNHESPLRGLEFVTRKISNAAAKIKLGLQNELRLGNINAKRDWGYAPEYVESMWTMLQQDEPRDYVIANNETHTVKEFVEIAFGLLDISLDKLEIDAELFRPLDVSYLQGDYSKARIDLMWQPKVRFKELVEIMVESDLDKWTRWLNGERFPWDAPNYPTELSILTETKKI